MRALSTSRPMARPRAPDRHGAASQNPSATTATTQLPDSDRRTSHARIARNRALALPSDGSLDEDDSYAVRGVPVALLDVSESPETSVTHRMRNRRRATTYMPCAAMNN